MDSIPFPDKQTSLHRFPGKILAGDLRSLLDELQRSPAVVRTLLLLTIGCSAEYGLVLGLWRSPEQALYVALKFPLVILAVTLGNAVANWIFAQLFGLKVSLKESFVMILTTFAIASIILSSLSPVSLFLLYNVPQVSSVQHATGNNLVTVVNVLFIIIAGTIANVRLYGTIVKMSGRSSAVKLITAWLFVNLMLGSQVSWILRPFIGKPNQSVTFLRGDAFSGNFFEDVLYKTSRISR